MAIKSTYFVQERIFTEVRHGMLHEVRPVLLIPWLVDCIPESFVAIPDTAVEQNVLK